MTIGEVKARRQLRGEADDDRMALVDWRFALAVGDAVYVTGAASAWVVLEGDDKYVRVAADPDSWYSRRFSRQTGKGYGIKAYITPCPPEAKVAAPNSLYNVADTRKAPNL